MNNPYQKAAYAYYTLVEALNDASIGVFYSKTGDFRTHEAIFEIGSKNKTRKQLKDIRSDSFIVKDNILLSERQVLPLLYFGF